MSREIGGGTGVVAYGPADKSCTTVAGLDLGTGRVTTGTTFVGDTSWGMGALPGGKYAPSLFGVSNQHIYEALITGPQQMPVFSDGVLKPDDKKAIIAYLNTLHEQDSQGGLTLGGLGPVSEGLWSWIIGIGGLMGIAVWIAAKGTKAK